MALPKLTVMERDLDYHHNLTVSSEADAPCFNSNKFYENRQWFLCNPASKETNKNNKQTEKRETDKQNKTQPN